MKRYIPICAATLLVLAGCAGKGSTDSAKAGNGSDDPLIARATSGWYYFSDSGIHVAKSPGDIPSRSFKAWTEAVRVADVAMVNDMPSFLINRLGLMTSGSGDESPALHTDAALFGENTAAALYNGGNGSLVRLYRNSFFADQADGQSPFPCLIRYEHASGAYAPFLTAADLDLPAEAQCVALDRIGSMWYAAFKHETGGKVDFTYLEFETFPQKSSTGQGFDLSGISRISSETYQKSVSPFSFAYAPDSLRSVLSGLPDDLPLGLRVYTPSTKSTQAYVREGNGIPVEGMAFVSDKKTAVLFADGRLYVRTDNATDKTHVLQLPALSKGYVYTAFILTAEKILAAWEEQRFFETGRAGLVEITLPDGLY